MTLPNKILSVLQGNRALSSRELAEHLDASWSTVKRHLVVLLEAGKVGREKDGRTNRYRLNCAAPRAIDSATTLEAMGVPDPVRLRYRELLNEAINAVVRERSGADQVVAGLELSVEEKPQFETLLRQELDILALHNCARYRLTMKQVKAWIEAGRPF
ncbi:winged helix-turn-helix transcriptional regulator [Pseudomonas sp. NPDC089996]|uniref:winged helix-turn-helix transcriptional regulator n=1 Tax=Pseudomonas sp. NPDC089996 TaxID=3364474 RepID=UPI00381FCE94